MKYLIVLFVLRPLTWCNYQLRILHLIKDKWFFADKLMLRWGFRMGSWKRLKKYYLSGGDFKETFK